MGNRKDALLQPTPEGLEDTRETELCSWRCTAAWWGAMDTSWNMWSSDSVYKWGFYLCLSWILTWIPSMITLKLKIMTNSGYCTILRGDKFCENLGKINREIASNRSIITHSKYQRRDVSFYGSCWIYNSWKRVWTADFWIVCCMLKIDFIMR